MTLNNHVFIYWYWNVWLTLWCFLLLPPLYHIGPGIFEKFYLSWFLLYTQYQYILSIFHTHVCFLLDYSIRISSLLHLPLLLSPRFLLALTSKRIFYTKQLLPRTFQAQAMSLLPEKVTGMLQNIVGWRHKSVSQVV